MTVGLHFVNCSVFIQTKVKVEWSVDDLRPIVPLPVGFLSRELQLQNRLILILGGANLCCGGT